MSVYAENLAVAYGESPADFVKGRWSDWHLAAVTAQRMRQLGQAVYPDAANQDSDDFHASHTAVSGPKDTKTRQKLAAEYEWIIAPGNRYVQS